MCAEAISFLFSYGLLGLLVVFYSGRILGVSSTIFFSLFFRLFFSPFCFTSYS